MNLSVIKLFVKGQTNSADIFEFYDRKVPIFPLVNLAFWKSRKRKAFMINKNSKKFYFCQVAILPVATLVFIWHLTKMSQWNLLFSFEIGLNDIL